MEKFHHKKSLIDDEDISKERLQALTDGVFAIVMTLLVLEIHVPEIIDVSSAHGLWLALATLAPKLISFAISFIILGMFWVAHHTEFHYIKKLDHKLIWLNIFYLLFISFLPFSAALIGSYTHNQAAVIVYGLHLVMLVLIHYAMWQHASEHKDLVIDYLDPRINKLVSRISMFAAASYVTAIVLSFFSLELSLIIYILVPLPYIFGWA